MLGELYKISREFPSEARWKNLYAVFETYSTTDLGTRIKAIKQLIKHLKTPDEEENKEKKRSFDNKNPEDTDVMYVKGVGPKVGALLNKLGIFTAYDLLHYFPRKHLDYASKTLISNLRAGEEVTVFGNIISVTYYTSKKKQNLTILTITISDGTGTLSINRFMGKTNRFMVERIKAQYPKGANLIVSGTVKIDDFAGGYTIDKPEMEAVSGDIEDCDSLHLNRIVPIYPVTENLNIKTLRRAIFNALETYANSIENSIPEEIRKKYDLIDKINAIRQIHFPDSMQQLEEARKTLVFEEFFLMQLKLAMIRQKQKTEAQGLILNYKKGGLVDKYVKSLPFTLTNGQKDAFDENSCRYLKTQPMRRLLQGDVGCGKTVVACMSLLAAVENGYQGAIMAPTEILAEQHYRSFSSWLTSLGLSAGLFIGKHGQKSAAKCSKTSKTDRLT